MTGRADYHEVGVKLVSRASDFCLRHPTPRRVAPLNARQVEPVLDPPCELLRPHLLRAGERLLTLQTERIQYRHHMNGAARGKSQLGKKILGLTRGLTPIGSQQDSKPAGVHVGIHHRLHFPFRQRRGFHHDLLPLGQSSILPPGLPFRR
jgi:hypothetical protein